MTTITQARASSLEPTGDAWSPWGPEVAITMQMVAGFAELTGDRQAIHLSEEAAKRGPFGHPVAHGFLILSLLPVLCPWVIEKLEGPGHVLNSGGLFQPKRPVPVGGRISARSRILSQDEERMGLVVCYGYEIANVTPFGMKTAMCGDLKLLFKEEKK